MAGGQPHRKEGRAKKNASGNAAKTQARKQRPRQAGGARAGLRRQPAVVGALVAEKGARHVVEALAVLEEGGEAKVHELQGGVGRGGRQQEVLGLEIAVLVGGFFLGGEVEQNKREDEGVGMGHLRAWTEWL